MAGHVLERGKRAVFSFFRLSISPFSVSRLNSFIRPSPRFPSPSPLFSGQPNPSFSLLLSQRSREDEEDEGDPFRTGQPGGRLQEDAEEEKEDQVKEKSGAKRLRFPDDCYFSHVASSTVGLFASQPNCFSPFFHQPSPPQPAYPHPKTVHHSSHPMLRPLVQYTYNIRFARLCVTE